jgi:hypothetical protein
MGLRDAQRNAEGERREREAAGKSNFNADRTRYISREYLGWVCYVGRVTGDGNFNGQRVGVTTEEATAQRWLDGADDIQWDIPADPFGNLVDTGGSAR